MARAGTEPNCPSPETLQALVGGTLAGDDRERTLVHVDSCDACHAAVVGLATDAGAIAETLADSHPHRRHQLAQPGTSIGRYEIERPIGMGGMGVVYVANDPKLGRKVAVKVLRGGVGSVERLRREGRALAALSHPNVVAVHDVGDHEDAMFIAMELVDGSNLRGWLTSRRRTWREVFDVALAVGRGLEAAHVAGLVHRDIKPDNILVGDDGRIRIGDFGLVDQQPSEGASDDVELTQAGTLLGTPAYMSPEQLDGDAADARSDQWSFCATIFEALYGVRAFVGSDVDSLSLAIERGEMTATPTGSGVPRWLRRIIVRGLSLEPSRRWPSMRALCDALERGRRRRRQILVLGPAAAVMVCVAGGWWLTRAIPFDCSDAGDVPSHAWNPIRRALIAAHNNDSILARGDAWIAAWSAARNDACRVNVADEPLRARREACLDHQLELFSNLAAWAEQTNDVEGQSEPADLGDWLPSVSRCGQSAVVDLPEPTPTQRAWTAVIEAEVARAVDLRRHDDTNAALAIAVKALGEAKASGYAPTIIDVAVPLALFQRHANDDRAAEATERIALDAAEIAHDDSTKTSMALHLVNSLSSNGHLDEARHFLDYAKASAAHLPASPGLEADIVEAEGFVANFAEDYAAASTLRRRAVDLRRKAYGADSFEVAASLTVFAVYLDRTDREEAARVRAELDTITKKTGRSDQSRQSLLDGMPKMMGNMFHATFEADLETAIRIGGELLATGERASADSLQLAGLYETVAALEALAGHHQPSLAHFARAADLWERLGTKSAMVTSGLNGAADEALELGRTSDSIAFARRAIEMATALHDDDAINNGRRVLGQALVASGDPAAAREPLQQAVAWRQDHGTGADRGQARFALATALWSDTPADRTRALELARVARADLAATLASFGPPDPLAGIKRGIQQRRLDKIDAWLRTHR